MDKITTDVPTIIVQGNPVDGFAHYGPFPNRQSAIDWADGPNSEVTFDWWIAPLFSVQEQPCKN